jgi:hypothetical protein
MTIRHCSHGAEETDVQCEEEGMRPRVRTVSMLEETVKYMLLASVSCMDTSDLAVRGEDRGGNVLLAAVLRPDARTGPGHAGGQETSR